MANRMVIDTSVAAKWFLRDRLEADTELAQDILDDLLAGDLELHAPRIFTYEMCGVLTKACKRIDPIEKRRRLTVEHANECIRLLFEYPIRISEATAEEGSKALQMAVNYSKTHDNMTFLRLAEIHNCKWCTADAKVLKGDGPIRFPIDRILLLSTLR